MMLQASSIFSTAPGRPAGDRFPTSINADRHPLFFANSSLSANGITSSARLCRITVPGFTVLAVPRFFQAGQSRTSLASPLLMFMATAPPRDDPTTTTWAGACRTRPGRCGRPRRSRRRQGRVDDLVAVLLQVGRLDAAGDRVPAVEEEDLHLIQCRRLTDEPCLPLLRLCWLNVNHLKSMFVDFAATTRTRSTSELRRYLAARPERPGGLVSYIVSTPKE